MKKATPPARDMRELTVGEAEQFWEDAVEALIAVLSEHDVAGSGSGYSLYTALADEMAKVNPFQGLEVWQIPEWRQGQCPTS
jgi:hypothetical protein